MRERAEALERELEERGAGGESHGSFGARSSSAVGESSGSPAASGSNERGAGGASDQMRRALAELQRGQVGEAAERAREALDRLGDLARALAAAGETATGREDSERLSAELQAADAVRRTLEALEARLGRIGAEARPMDNARSGGSRQPEEAERTDGEPASVEQAAGELLRRLEELPDLRDALAEARPGVLEDLVRWAGLRPTGGGPAFQAVEQDFAAWESLPRRGPAGNRGVSGEPHARVAGGRDRGASRCRRR